MTAPTLPPTPSPTPRSLNKPRLRGVIHYWSLFISVATGATLIALAGSTVSAQAAGATAVYSLAVCGLFGFSALYHCSTWTSVTVEYWFKQLDHSMIFVFIAGTYTPFAVLALPPTTGAVVLGLVWAGATVGVLMKVLWHSHPRWLEVPVYVAMGWLGAFVVTDLLAMAGVAPVVLLVVGGLLYTAGGVAYALKWPNPWPRTFGFHEVFHAATVLAAICHYIAVWLTMYAAA